MSNATMPCMHLYNMLKAVPAQVVYHAGDTGFSTVVIADIL